MLHQNEEKYDEPRPVFQVNMVSSDHAIRRSFFRLIKTPQVNQGLTNLRNVFSQTMA